MDKNVTIERCLNMTHLPRPVAESTCLNLNGSRAGGDGRSGVREFHWGGSPMSPKNHNNSNICFNNGSTGHKSRSTAASPQRARTNLSKIDPRIYADVQSRGLASRIVQYHENGSRLHRSISASNLYSKRAQYSMTNLQKNELPFRAMQQNVSLTRIEPPQKSLFYGNTLTSLLRSNSVIGLQKSDEEISRENRPILHPPATEGELAPTRSVLDVLKEISRKRINSDDSRSTYDSTKKYCSRDCHDGPYEQSIAVTDSRNVIVPVVTTTMTSSASSYKRQREAMAPALKSPLHHTQNTYGVNVTATATSRSPTHEQNSPEQVAKKRLCGYNNDITSSLSSSLLHANKRKFYEQHRSAWQSSPSLATEECEAQKSKMQCQQSDSRFQQITNSLICNTPITPITTTPLSQCINLPSATSNGEKSLLPSSDVVGLTKRTISEPPFPVVKLASKPQKTKITLFNRDYSASKNACIPKNNNTELLVNGGIVDDAECADIQFVKPKKSSMILNKKNPLIERTQKSKLAMMLSGLRGEIYQGDDEVDMSNKPVAAANSSGSVVVNVTSSSVVNTTNTAATTTTTTIDSNVMLKVPDKSNISTPTVPDNIPISDNNLSQTTVSSSTNTTPKGTATTPPGVVSTGTASTTVSTSSQSCVAKATSPLMGIKLTPKKTPLNFVASTSVPTFNFVATSINSTAGSNKPTANTMINISTVPQLQGFVGFGPTTKPTTAVTSTIPNATTTAATTSTQMSDIGGFKFGPIQTTSSTAAAPSMPVEITTNTTTTTGMTPFAVFNNVSGPPFTTSVQLGKNNNAANSSFALGAASTNTTAAIVKPTFSFSAGNTLPATASGTITSNTFTFVGATNAKTTATTSIAAAMATGAATQPSSVFNAAAPIETTAKPFTFGPISVPLTTATATTTSVFSFSGAATSNLTSNAAAVPAITNIFSFGGDKPTATTTAASVTTTPHFSFGQPAPPAKTTATVTATPQSAFSFAGTLQNGPDTFAAVANTKSSSVNLFAFGTTATAQPTKSDNKIFANTSMGGNNNAPPSVSAPSKPAAFTFTSITPQSATPAFDAPNATSKSPFAFGANANKPTVVPTTTPAPAATGGFSFSSAAPGALTTNTTMPTNLFGTTTGLLSGKPFNSTRPNSNQAANCLFGANTTNNTANNAASGNSTFGALGAATNNQANNTFNFGGDIATNANTASNPFAATVNRPPSGGFSFSSNKPITTGSAPNATPFAFGGPGNSGASTTAAPFSFGSCNNGATPNITFTFGSSNNSSATGASNMTGVFGGTVHNSTGAAPTTVTPFSFPTGTTAAAVGSSMTATTTPGNGDRPIRRATRRLQKT